jgi:hypothetical protein
VPGAEVVDGELHAELLQLGERSLRTLVTLDDDGLGDFSVRSFGAIPLLFSACSTVARRSGPSWRAAMFTATLSGV